MPNTCKRSVMRRRAWLGSAVILAAGLGAPSAMAQDMFGALEAQGAFAAQQNLAASVHAYYSGGQREELENRVSQYSAGPVMSDAEIAALREEARLEESQRQAAIQAWRAGKWEFFQSRETAKPGEFCTAMYQNPQGLIALGGFDASWDGALLMLTGEAIPEPRRFEEITVTLTQTGEPPAAIRAFNREHDPNMHQLGTIVIAVPSMEAALAGMTDEQEFVLTIRNREVFRMAWKDGLRAADELRKCLRKR